MVLLTEAKSRFLILYDVKCCVAVARPNEKTISKRLVIVTNSAIAATLVVLKSRTAMI